jgi:hypothetical protein
MKDLPPEHVPSSLIEAASGQVSYAVAQRTRTGFAMFFGPTLDINEALEAVPTSTDMVIVRYDPCGGDEVIYRWVAGNPGKWKRCV